MNKLKGYRTIIFNVIMGLAAIFGATELDPADVNLAIAGGGAAWMIGNVILRAITNTSIGNKK